MLTSNNENHFQTQPKKARIHLALLQEKPLSIFPMLFDFIFRYLDFFCCGGGGVVNGMEEWKVESVWKININFFSSSKCLIIP